jgi:hypothetical protein
MPQSYYFCIKNALKLTYNHLYVLKKKFLGSLSLAMKGRDYTRRKWRGGRGEGRRDGGKGREGKGREGKGREGKRRERKGRGKAKVREKERSRGYSPPNLELCPCPWSNLILGYRLKAK